MNRELLTIVIMTRDRTDLLKLCLRSVFEYQASAVKVIVSDNSTKNHPEINVLRKQYGFSYVRQSGRLSITEHHNTCLKLPSCRWVWLVHDDDEVFPGSVGKVKSFLNDCKNVGIVIGGVEYIDQESKVQGTWLPKVKKIVRGEEALLGLGLDWGVRAPSQIFGVHESLQNGGFQDMRGLPADYAFAVLLAFSHGVAFCHEFIGRYRLGPQQVSIGDSDREKTEAWLKFTTCQAELIRVSGCAPSTADRVADYLNWWAFLVHAPPWLESNPAFVYRLVRECLKASPWKGEWQKRVRSEYPFLFWRPQCLAWPLYRAWAESRRLLDILRRKNVLNVLRKSKKG
ncbi:MAG: glycosyltransferase family 2 protein [Nitrospiraceae bacterium]